MKRRFLFTSWSAVRNTLQHQSVVFASDKIKNKDAIFHRKIESSFFVNWRNFGKIVYNLSTPSIRTSSVARKLRRPLKVFGGNKNINFDTCGNKSHSILTGGRAEGLAEKYPAVGGYIAGFRANFLSHCVFF